VVRWGDTGRYEEIRGATGSYGEVWGDTGRCGAIWGHQGGLAGLSVDGVGQLRPARRTLRARLVRVGVGVRVRVGVRVGVRVRVRVGVRLRVRLRIRVKVGWAPPPPARRSAAPLHPLYTSPYLPVSPHTSASRASQRRSSTSPLYLPVSPRISPHLRLPRVAAPLLLEQGGVEGRALAPRLLRGRGRGRGRGRVRDRGRGRGRM
jgi:hypothetical protein